MQRTAEFIIKGTLILTLSNFLIRFLSYFYRILMARFLLPKDYGLLLIALSFQYLMVVLSSSGIAPTIAKFISASEEGEKNTVAISACLNFFLLGIIGGFFVFIFSDFIANAIFKENSLGVLIKIISVSIPFSLAIASFSGILQGEKSFFKMSVLLVSQQALVIVLSLIFIKFYLGSSAISATLGAASGFVFASFFGFALAFHAFRGWHINFPELFKIFAEIFKFSVPVSLTSISTFLLAYVDILLLGALKGSEKAGIYGAAAPTSRIILAFSAALYATILPKISELKHARDREEIKKSIKFGMLLQSIAMLFFISLLLIFARDIITFLFPKKAYLAAIAPFKILIFSSSFLGAFMFLAGFFQGIGKPALPAKLLMLAALINFILNLILIPEFSLIGAAFASLFSTFFALFLISIFFFREVSGINA